MGGNCCKNLQEALGFGGAAAREPALLREENGGVELKTTFSSQAPAPEVTSSSLPPPSVLKQDSGNSASASVAPQDLAAAPEADRPVQGLIEMSFAEPPPGGKFADSYEREPKDNFVFLIPGDETLFVGGGALNGAVGRLLLKEADQPIAFELDDSGSFVKVMDEGVGREVPLFHKEECHYGKLHNTVFPRARAIPNKLVVASAEEFGEAPVIFSGARVFNDGEWPFGAIFLDIFQDDKRPFSSRNIGLMYTAGPLGRNKRAPGEGLAEASREDRVKTNAQDFVHDIFFTGQNCISAIVEYNKDHASSSSALPHVNIVRLPIVSGGTFIHPEVSATEAALALIWGVRRALAASPETLRPAVELMPEEAMREAYRMYMDNLEPSSWNTEEKKFLFNKIADLFA